MNDPFKKETYSTLQSMGYNYVLVDLAYKRAPIKTTEGVINYIMSNPGIRDEADSQISSGSRQQSSKSTRKGPQIDMALKGQLLMMGFLEPQIDAALVVPGVNSIDKAIAWISSNPDAGKEVKKGRKVPARRPRGVKKEVSRGAGRTKKTNTTAARGTVAGRKGKTNATGGRGTVSRRTGKRISSGAVAKKGTKITKGNPKKPQGGTRIGNTKAGDEEVPQIEFGTFDPNSVPKVIDDSKLEIGMTKEEKEAEEKRQQELERKRLRREMLKRAKERELDNKRNPPPKPEPRMEEKKKPSRGMFSKKPKTAKIEKIEKNEKTENISKAQQQKLQKDRAKKEILKQLAIDKAKRFGTEIKIEDEVVTTEDRFLEIYEKMESIYPIRTPKAKKLKTCLTTIGIYLSKNPKQNFIQKIY